MKKKRIPNLRNIFLALVFIICLAIVLHDIYFLLIEPIFTTYVRGWTWLGFITFISSLIACVSIFDYFYEQIKNIPNDEQKDVKNNINK